MRRGFFGLVRLEPFADRVVLPHEHTLSAPKQDRRKLMRATRTQFSQVFGLYRDPGGRDRRARFAGRERGAARRGRHHRRRLPAPPVGGDRRRR